MAVLSGQNEEESIINFVYFTGLFYLANRVLAAYVPACLNPVCAGVRLG